ncbi:hypothetical protein [Pseudomonas sp. B28(2017)]|uniref:hypothetical protein n=1 Tax=Pseudomonas sp. B28(2017) TaxID=1981730 RepID=UPI000A1FB1D9|nr:hypothetical protein [Pseudomonas sp. B28(2017)]
MTTAGENILNSDLVIVRDELGRWKLESAGVYFFLIEASDFKRIISLLEMPINDVKLALGPDFPYMSVAEVGLKHDSDYWISLAISWVAGSSVRDAFAFIDDLKRLSKDKAVSQRNRQLAKKEIKRLLNG